MLMLKIIFIVASLVNVKHGITMTERHFIFCGFYRPNKALRRLLWP